MTIELTVAELADVTELDLGASPWRRVEQHRVDTFADAMVGESIYLTYAG